MRRVTPVAMEPGSSGRVSRARAVFERPGDVAMLMYDAGPEGGEELNDGAVFWAGPRAPGWVDIEATW